MARVPLSGSVDISCHMHIGPPMFGIRYFEGFDREIQQRLTILSYQRPV